MGWTPVHDEQAAERGCAVMRQETKQGLCWALAGLARSVWCHLGPKQRCLNETQAATGNPLPPSLINTVRGAHWPPYTALLSSSCQNWRGNVCAEVHIKMITTLHLLLIFQLHLKQISLSAKSFNKTTTKTSLVWWMISHLQHSL